MISTINIACSHKLLSDRNCPYASLFSNGKHELHASNLSTSFIEEHMLERKPSRFNCEPRTQCLEIFVDCGNTFPVSPDCASAICLSACHQFQRDDHHHHHLQDQYDLHDQPISSQLWEWSSLHQQWRKTRCVRDWSMVHWPGVPTKVVKWSKTLLSLPFLKSMWSYHHSALGRPNMSANDESDARRRFWEKAGNTKVQMVKTHHLYDNVNC